MNRTAFLLLKIILFVLLSWFIINRLFLQSDFKEQFRYFMLHLRADHWYLFILALALMPVNWGLETIKWKSLLQTQVPYVKLLKSIAAGITIGFVTPGRTGEFAGRVMFLNETGGARIFYLSSIGGLAQTAASLAVGIPFVMLWGNSTFLTGIVTGCAVFYTLAFFRFDVLNRFFSSVPVLQRYGLIMDAKALPHINTQLYVLLLSALRFAVYSMQYVLLLMFLGLGNLLALATHSIVYLLAQTFSPLMPLLDISYRGASALVVFKNYTSNNIAVLCAVMLVWLINLVIPAIAGYIFILRNSGFSFISFKSKSLL